MSLRDMGDRSQKSEVRIKAGDGVGEVPAMSLRDMGDRSQKSEVRIKAGDSVGQVPAMSCGTWETGVRSQKSE
jgi:hypothetical protein